MLRGTAVLFTVVLATVVTACGGSDDARAPAASAQARGAAAVLSRSALQVRLGNAFRAGLYGLAVMSQPEDKATDLGQPLPTGKLRSVDCAPAGDGATGARAWGCTVAWKTVTGSSRRTRYSVRLTDRSCYDAAAAPPLASVLDATIGAMAEHPLNTFGRSLGTC